MSRSPAHRDSGKTQPDPFLILTHPHREFDREEASASFMRGALRAVPSSNVLVLTDKTFAPYVEISGEAKVIHSELGEVKADQLGFLSSNAHIKLLGGYACQCHLKTFRHIAQAVQAHNFENVRVTIPYAGCFVTHQSSTDARGTVKEGPSGTALQILEQARPAQRDSYHLAEIGRYKYDLTKVQDFPGFIPLLRNPSGAPQETTPVERDGVLYRIYFDRYLGSNRSKLPPYCVAYDGESITFILNPDPQIRRHYEDEVVRAASVDRYPLMSPDLLEAAAANKPNRAQFLRGYIHRIVEEASVLSAATIKQYGKVFQDVDHSELRAITAERDLNTAIKSSDLALIQGSLAAGARITREVNLSPLYSSERGPEILSLLLPHFSEHQVIACWIRCAQEGNCALAERVRPFLTDLHVEVCPADGDALKNALESHQFSYAEYLLQIGMDPKRLKHLLGTVAVYMDLEVLERAMALINFSDSDKHNAFGRVVGYYRHYSADNKMTINPKLVLLGMPVDDEHLDFAREHGFSAAVDEILAKRRSV